MSGDGCAGHNETRKGEGSVPSGNLQHHQVGVTPSPDTSNLDQRDDGAIPTVECEKLSFTYENGSKWVSLSKAVNKNRTEKCCATLGFK